MSDRTILLIGGELDLERRELRGPSGAQALTPRQAALLAALLAEPGQAVDRAAIQAQVWPGRAAISSGSLHQLVFEIRKLFEDAGIDPDSLETVQGRGYRLAMGDVRGVSVAERGAADIAVTPDSTVDAKTFEPVAGRSRIGWIGAGVLAVAIAVGGIWGTSHWRRGERVAAICAEAYSLIDRASEPHLAQANELFRSALSLEPGSALALAGLAEASARFGGGAKIPIINVAGQEMSTFQQLAREAVRRDPDCGRCQGALGYVLGTRDFKIQEAEATLAKAVTLEPSVWRYRVWLAQYHTAMGHPDQGLREIDEAIRLAPVESGPLADKAGILYFLKRYDDAIALADRAVAINPRSEPAIDWRSRAHLMKHMYREYVDDRGAATAFWMGWADEAREAWIDRVWRSNPQDTFGRLIAVNADNPTYNYERAVWHMVRDERDLAMADLQKAAVSRPYYILFVKVDPVFEPLHSDARFQQIVRNLGLG